MTINPSLSPTRSRRQAAWVVAGMIIVAVIYLRWQGRVWWCAAGDWYPISLKVQSEHNSQHLLDAYSLSHVLHGLLFAGLFWLVPRLSYAWKFTAATFIEVVWEMMENSPIIINRYREGTISLGYTGDSIVNSLGDIASYMFGFWIARKLGLWKSVAIFIITELLMLWWIRDNLTLNVLMLLWPIDAIRKWQAGA